MRRKQYTFSLSILLLLLFPLVLAAPAAWATEPTRLLMILDASGSMWGRVDAQPKITIAQTAAAEVMQSLPQHVAAGLMLYGHRRKGDCRDIELAVTPGAPRQQLVTQLAGLTPKGKTPLAQSLEQAGELLSQGEGEATVLLISDGIETCGGDPCAVVAALRQKGIKLVVHVVGFDVRGAAVEQLQCIARAGGGGYFQANDTTGLRQALQSVRSAVVEHKAPAPPPEPVQAAAVPEASSSSKRVRIAGPGTVELVPAPWVKMPPRQWALVEAESGERRAEGSGATASVKEGEYQVLWRQSEHGHGEIQLTETVQVSSGQTTKLALDTGLKLVLPAGTKAPYWWGLRPASEPLDHDAKAPAGIIFRSTLEPQLTPAGTYQLLWRQDEYLRTIDLGPITIVSGRLNEVAVDSGLMLQPADWVTQQPYYYALLDAQGKQAARWRSYGPQLAPPGRYTLIFRPSEHGHRDIVWSEVVIPSHGILALPLNSGIQFIHAQEAKPPYRITLVNLADTKEVVMQQSWEHLPLPPGRYRLDWQQSEYGSKRSTLVDELVIEAGTLLEIEM